jgi:Cu(I)/Ag(I) efflux system protein CusF
MIKRWIALFLAVLLTAPLAFGSSHDKLSDGEVRKVDKAAKKITIKHGPLANLDMPAMTMVFRVKDPAMLDKVKAGDKVKFEAQKVDGNLTLVRLEPAQ